MIPKVVLIDPELTVSLPPDVTAQTGMDAITQLIESYLSRRAQPIPQALAESGLRVALGSLATAVTDGSNRKAPRGWLTPPFFRESRWPTRGWEWPMASRPP